MTREQEERIEEIRRMLDRLNNQPEREREREQSEEGGDNMPVNDHLAVHQITTIRQKLQAKLGTNYCN